MLVNEELIKCVDYTYQGQRQKQYDIRKGGFHPQIRTHMQNKEYKSNFEHVNRTRVEPVSWS